MFASDVEFPSMLRGVSTQRWDIRTPGGLDESLNMLNDPVTGLRRRPGFSLKTVLSSTLPTASDYVTWFQELNGYSVHIVLETTTGTVRVFDTAWALLAQATSTYLQAAKASSIKHLALAGTAWVANTEKPAGLLYTETRLDPVRCGYVQCLLGEYERAYTTRVEVTYTLAGTTYVLDHTVTYTTPAAGAGTTQAALPTTVAEQLRTLLVAAFAGDAVTLTGTRSGHVTFLYATPAAAGAVVTDTRVTTTNTNTYLLTSERMVVPLATALPNRLPDVANGCIVAQGTSASNYVYYQYNAKDNVWGEARAYGYVSAITQPPALLTLSGGVGTFALSITTSNWPGANAGNATTNKVPPWVTGGISGLTAIQGRLGIFSGDTVSFSETGYPTRHFRSTVASLAATDRISVSGGSAASATFTASASFNKDLLLFSESHLCVIPVGNTVLTPSNTAIQTNCRLSSAGLVPVDTGQSVQFLSNTNPPAIYEVTPGADVTTVYNVASATDHIRGYLPSGITWALGLPGIGVSVFANADTMLVNEYIWAGAERPLNAWHKWTPPTGVSLRSLHATHDSIVAVFWQQNAGTGGHLLFCELAPRNALDPVLDLWQSLGWTDTGFPHDAAEFLPDNTFWAVGDTGAVRCTRLPSGAVSLPMTSAATWYVGTPFTSTIQLPPYIPRTREGSNQYRDAVLVQAELDVAGTGEFLASVPGYEDIVLAGIAWTDENFDQYRNSSQYIKVPVPVRERMPLAYVRLSTTQPYQLNILRCVYRTRLNNQFRRL